MNQNRNSSNRRRGRSNRGPGGGNQSNRIDSRARGNAPQLLEKYKKLAHDASLNGDRVQTEYYLQFADHYFRVVADGKVAKDDQQQRPRQYDRDQDGDSDHDDETGDEPGSGNGGDRNHRPSHSDRTDRQVQKPRDDDDNQASAEANPFVREAKPRRARTPRAAENREPAGLDPSSLPPAIGKDSAGDNAGDDADEAPARRRTRTRRPAGGDEAIEAAS